MIGLGALTESVIILLLHNMKIICLEISKVAITHHKLPWHANLRVA